MEPKTSCWHIFFVFLKLGITSFGGPIAHIGYFRDEFVTRRQWLSERDYADLVALCQFLPGPASSQVGMALGMMRANYAGALAAWLGFTLPSALLLIAAAIGLQHWATLAPTALSATTLTTDPLYGLLHGLKLVAVAVVAQAVWGMGKTLCNDTAKITMMLCAVLLLSLWTSIWPQVTTILLGAVMGYLWFGPHARSKETHAAAAPATTAAVTDAPAAANIANPIRHSRKSGAAWGVAWLLLLVGLPLLAMHSSSSAVALFDAFFRAGSLVFGGGHVVLPLLQAEVVPTGMVDAQQFMAGYGAAQAVPGPLFSFAAFLGASMPYGPTGMPGLPFMEGLPGIDSQLAYSISHGVLALVAIFLPAFMILAAVLPYWQAVRSSAHIQAAMAGVGASVVGILVSALYQPIWRETVGSATDFAAIVLVYVALVFWKIPVWLIVLTAAVAGAGFSYIT
jgi:chromate transporter